MKKILLSLVAIAVTLFANAADYEIYITGTVQQGGSSTLSIMMKNTQPIMTINTQITLPAGITVTGISDKKDVPGAYSIDASDATKLTLVYATAKDVYIPASTEAVEIGKLTVTVSDDIDLGSHDVTVSGTGTSMAIYPSATSAGDFSDYTSSINVQRAAVIEPMGTDYALEVIPFALTTGATSSSLAVNMTNKDEVAYISFDLEYPTKITPTKGTRAFNKPTVNADRLTNGGEVTPLSAKAPTLVSGTTSTYHYELTNDDIDTYASNGSGLALTLPITCSSLNDGVYTFKMSNISVKSTTDYTTFTDHTGDYYFSVFVGTPTETDPVVYGHYTTEGQAALKAAATNFASVDMSSATLNAEESAVASDLTEKLIYGPAKTSYNRTVTGYGTVCLPFELTSDKGAQYYTVASANDNSITFAATKTVAANTPAIVKGTVNASADGYQYASKNGAGKAEEVNGLTLTGTYTKYNLTSGDGYYISADDKGNSYFYGDGATIAPFRAYFAGTVSSSKLSIFIEDATGIHDITNQLSNEDIYNLQGIKLNKANKGVNIIGGKKVLIK